MKGNQRIGKRLWKLLGIATVVFLFVVCSVVLWIKDVEAQAHVKPSYPKENIEYLLDKNFLEQTDYKLLFQQTGMGPSAVDFLFANNRQQELLELQELFFADVEVDCEDNTIVTREERIEEIIFQMEEKIGTGRRKMDKGKSVDRTRVSIPYVEEGDILISFNCHALGWRNGHAAIVVDSKERLALEARVLGTDSAVMSMAHWERYPSFVVLRLKNTTKEERGKVAAYAAEKLVDIPYRLEAGIWDRTQKTKEVSAALSGTHCAHLIWYAYQQFGYDLDSDGGVIVTPRDLYESPYLEIVQLYGMSFPDADA